MRPVVHINPITGGQVVRSSTAARGRCGCPKQAYSSRKLALARAVEASKSKGEDIRAYHCVRGHCWHIGHPPGSRAA